MKKILLALCVLLFAFPAWAANPVVQGDAQFVYSPIIDAGVNPVIDTIQIPIGTDPETGDIIYDYQDIYEYTSVTSPSVTLMNLDNIFPSRLDGMAFRAQYYSNSGKTGIFPGIFTFQFSRDEIRALPNGAAIINDIETAEDPVGAFFKYFDPFFVVYGPDGEKVSINIKNFSFDFNFITEEPNIMALSFPVVLADGYPKTFCIEQINGYPFVYDAMVSETNASIIGDKRIEVAFALVPNERATNVAMQDFPIFELNDEKGYVIFDDPSEYLNISQVSDVSAAVIFSGNTFFINTENGFSFAANVKPEKNAIFVQCAVHSEKTGTLRVNGYSLKTEEILLPDDTRYLITSFVLVNGSFATSYFVSDNVVYIFDGLTNDVLTATVEIVTEPVKEIEDILSSQDIFLKRANLQLEGREEADAVFELSEDAIWPGKEGVSNAACIGSFVGAYEGIGKYVPLQITLSIPAETFQDLSRTGYDIVLSTWEEDPFMLFDFFHIYKQIGNFVYDLVMMGGWGIFTISGDPTAKINISFNAILVDDVGVVYFDNSASAFIVYDGSPDGKLVDPLFVGALQLEAESRPDQLVLNSPSISLKLADMDTSFLYSLEEAEADFEYLGLTDWPGKEGVLDAVSVGSFEGTYDGIGKYVPLKMEVSVTSYDLDRLSKDRHDKVISKWSEDKMAFLDYFHVYKQIEDLTYDLVMMGEKSIFTVSGDPTTKVTVSFPAILIDDVGNTRYEEGVGFIFYDGSPDGKLVDPLFIGTPEQVSVEETEEETEEEEIKHILPDNPEGSSTGHSDLDKWIKILSLF